MDIIEEECEICGDLYPWSEGVEICARCLGLAACDHTLILESGGVGCQLPLGHGGVHYSGPWPAKWPDEGYQWETGENNGPDWFDHQDGDGVDGD